MPGDAAMKRLPEKLYKMNIPYRSWHAAFIWLVFLSGCHTAQEVAFSPIVVQRNIRGDLGRVADCISQNIASSRYHEKWGIRRSEVTSEITLRAARIDSFVYGNDTYDWAIVLRDQGALGVRVTVQSATEFGSPLVPTEAWTEYVQPCAIQ